MNKNQIISAILLLTAMGASAQDIAIENKNIDCGQVVFKHPVTAEYVMKNNGASPLTISDVRTSCGCTTVSYPKEAIAQDNRLPSVRSTMPRPWAISTSVLVFIATLPVVR